MELRSLFQKKEDRSLKKLTSLPRFQTGTFRDQHHTITYIDALSFYNEYIDIFKKRIYHFATTNTSPQIIDAGGYIGLATLYFKTIYPDAKITIFEPDTKIFPVLQENIAHLNNVTAIEKGLGREEKTISFYPDKADGGSIFGTKNDTPTQIQVTKLSQYITQPIDLLKMNIEGAEGEVFSEIAEKLPLINEIIFEYHAFAELPQSLGNILQLLDKNNFRYLVTDATSAKIPIPFNLPNDYKCFNLVYAKNMCFK